MSLSLFHRILPVEAVNFLDACTRRLCDAVYCHQRGLCEQASSTVIPVCLPEDEPLQRHQEVTATTSPLWDTENPHSYTQMASFCDLTAYHGVNTDRKTASDCWAPALDYLAEGSENVMMA